MMRLGAVGEVCVYAKYANAHLAPDDHLIKTDSRTHKREPIPAIQTQLSHSHVSFSRNI